MGSGYIRSDAGVTDRDVVRPEPVADPPSPPPAAPAAATGSGSRLAWLDVLRGIAALAVVFDHLSYYVLQALRHIVYQWFNPGNYGVFVFFMISGYIVPASLERKGSVRTFWVSRLFRLYPLYLLVVMLAVALAAVHLGGLRGAESLPNVVWSLSYEMVVYLLLTALLAARIHRRSGW